MNNFFFLRVFSHFAVLRSFHSFLHTTLRHEYQTFRKHFSSLSCYHYRYHSFDGSQFCLRIRTPSFEIKVRKPKIKFNLSKYYFYFNEQEKKNFVSLKMRKAKLNLLLIVELRILLTSGVWHGKVGDDGKLIKRSMLSFFLPRMFD